MFSFEMPRKKEDEDVLHPGETLVENAEGLWPAFKAGRAQFEQIEEDIKSDRNIEEIKKVIKDKPYLPLLRYLKKNKVFLSENLLNKNEDYADMVARHDSLIKDLNEFKTKKELKNTLEDIDKLFSEANFL